MSGVPSWAVRGAKCVCIKDGVTLNNLGLDSPKVGGIYTIDRAFVLAQTSHPAMLHDEPVAIVVEHPRVANSLSMFRPATRLEQDVELIKHLTQPAAASAPAPADG